MRNRVSWIVALTLATLTSAVQGVPPQSSGARDLYLEYGEDQPHDGPGRPGVKLSIELERNGKVLMVPPEHIFRSGDRIRLHFKPNFDGHITILGIGTSGRVSQLFPYPGASSEVRKGSVKLMPVADDWWVFDHRTGEEQLVLILSQQPPVELTSMDVGAKSTGSTSGSASTGGIASLEEEVEILAVLNSRALRAGRDLFLQQSSGDSSYVVTTSEDALGQPAGVLVKLTHEGVEP